MAVVGRAEATPLRLLGTLSPPKTRAGAEWAVEAVLGRSCPPPGSGKSPRADEIGLREGTPALSPWTVEGGKGLRESLESALLKWATGGSPDRREHPRLMETPLLLDVTSNVFSLSVLPENC